MQRSGVLDVRPAGDLGTEAEHEPDTYPLDATWGPWGHSAHWHPHHQFLTAAVGSCQLTVGGDHFDVSTDRGLWIPRGVVHSARYGEDFVSLAFRVGSRGPERPTALEIPKALRRVLVAWQWTEDRGHIADHERTLAEYLGEPRGLSELAVAEPDGPLTAPVAAHLRRDPANQRTLTDWARVLHTSVASLRRAFLAETGISYSEWRTRYRLNLSLPGLRAGRQVAVVAREVGFTSNGYTLAFRRHLGCAPSHFTGSRPPAP